MKPINIALTQTQSQQTTQHNTKQLLDWINNQISKRKLLPVTSIKQLSSGNVFLQIISLYHPKKVDLTKTFMNPKDDYQILQNYKQISSTFTKLGWKKIDSQKFRKRKQKDILLLAQYLRKILSESLFNDKSQSYNVQSLLTNYQSQQKNELIMLRDKQSTYKDNKDRQNNHQLLVVGRIQQQEKLIKSQGKSVDDRKIKIQDKKIITKNNNNNHKQTLKLTEHEGLITTKTIRRNQINNDRNSLSSQVVIAGQSHKLITNHQITDQDKTKISQTIQLIPKSIKKQVLSPRLPPHPKSQLKNTLNIDKQQQVNKQQQQLTNFQNMKITKLQKQKSILLRKIMEIQKITGRQKTKLYFQMKQKDSENCENNLSQSEKNMTSSNSYKNTTLQALTNNFSTSSPSKAQKIQNLKIQISNVLADVQYLL